MKKQKSSKYSVDEKVFVKIKDKATGKYKKILATVVDPAKNSEDEIVLKEVYLTKNSKGEMQLNVCGQLLCVKLHIFLKQTVGLK